MFPFRLLATEMPLASEAYSMAVAPRRSGEIKLVSILVLVREYVVIYLRMTMDNCINTIVSMCMHIKPSVFIMELLVEAATRMRDWPMPL